jgi:hypothetical protein
MPIDQRSGRPFDPSASEPTPNRRTAASEPTLSNPPISPELALVDPVLHRTAALGEGERQEADVIDNGNPYANGNGAGHGIAQLAEPTPADAPAAEPSPETLLFRTGLLSPDQLGELVQERVASGRTVEEIVVERGWLDAAAIAAALSQSAASEPVPAPAVEPHPDPFAIPVAEPTAQPTQFAAATFEIAPSPEPQELQPVAAEPEVLSFAPAVVELPVEPAPVEPAPVELASVEPAPVEPAPVEPAPVVLEPVVLEPVVLEPVVQEQPAAAELAAPAASVEFRVTIRFVGNECVEIASHADAVAAKAAAQALVAQLSQERGEWPFVGGRFVRPDAVLSVDVDAVVR